MQAMQALKDYNIVPIESEVPIICEHIDLATSIDIIGLNKSTNAPVLISIKTGYNNNIQKKTIQKMNTPLHEIDNCPLNHHQLQGLIERYILKREYNITINDYFILYLNHDIFGNYKMMKMESWCKNDKLCEDVLLKIKQMK
ncbi:MAG: hypothetical protein MUO21_09705 [Nitrososphaeraceae archaeon]|nr:hypothetical protein [Nitrososphaeraceae archaeon]